MAFPTLVRVATAVSATSNNTAFTPSWTYTTNTAIATDERVLWVAGIAEDGFDALTTASGWTVEHSDTGGGSLGVSGTILTLETTAAYAAGSAPALTVNNAGGSAEQYSGILFAWKVAAGKSIGKLLSSAAASASSTNSNPPSITNSSGASQDVSVACFRFGDSTTVATVAPTNYTGLVSRAGGGPNGASTNAARRDITIANAGTEDPGTFTSATEQWVADTIGVYEFTSGPATHDSSGALAGPGSAVAGSAARSRSMDASGALTGQGSAVVGAAVHNISHASSGALVGQGSTVSGAAARMRAHAATGALPGQVATVSGVSARFRAFAASGVLSGPGASLSGSSVRIRGHEATGALQGVAATITGSAARASGVVSHDASGALSGPGSAANGVAARFRGFSSSGSLVGSGSAIAATSVRIRVFSSSGILSGAGAVVAGAADRIGSAVSHDSTGALVCAGSSIGGAAARVAIHAASGALIGGAAAIGTGPQRRFIRGFMNGFAA